MTGWFVERYEHDGIKAAEVRYVRDCQAMLAALKDWKVTAPDGSRFRLYAQRVQRRQSAKRYTPPAGNGLARQDAPPQTKVRGPRSVKTLICTASTICVGCTKPP